MNKHIFLLSEVTKHSTSRDVGTKAWNLGKLVDAGVMVPEGIVIAKQFFNFDWADEKVVEEKSHEVVALVETLHSQSFAVRSSATKEDSRAASFAGQFETVLGVKSSEILSAVEKILKSAQSDRIKTYAENKELSLKEVEMAVLIQRQLNSECSGIAFTVHPVSGDQNIVVIEGGYGLGELFVSGQVTPTHWEVNKLSGEVKLIDLGGQDHKMIIENGEVKKIDLAEIEKEKTCLNTIQIKDLSKASQQIEQLFGIAQDIEWAVESGKLYILQARPITVL